MVVSPINLVTEVDGWLELERLSGGARLWREEGDSSARERSSVTSVLQVVDSSGWIEVFTNGPCADRFLKVLDY